MEDLIEVSQLLVPPYPFKVLYGKLFGVTNPEPWERFKEATSHQIPRVSSLATYRTVPPVSGSSGPASVGHVKSVAVRGRKRTSTADKGGGSYPVQFVRLSIMAGPEEGRMGWVRGWPPLAKDRKRVERCSLSTKG